MNNNDGLITPPEELVGQWLCDDGYPWDPSEQVTITITTNRLRNVATQAARWGWEQRGGANEAELQKARDEELEACCEWLNGQRWEALAIHLRSARRPKPPSLKEQALADFDGLMSELDGAGNYSNCAERIRRALEQLDD